MSMKQIRDRAPHHRDTRFSMLARSRIYTILAGALLATGACAPAASTPQGTAQPSPEAGMDRAVPPVPGPAPAVDLPSVVSRTLSNGLRLLVVEDRELPLVTMRLVVNAGSAAEPRGSAGLASFTAAMLDEGTATRSALEIAEELEFLGANLGAGAGYDAAFLDLSVLSHHLPVALQVFSDVLTRPSFPPQEMERLRAERLTAILQSRDRAATVANEEFATRIYGPEHPYGLPLMGLESTVRGFAAGDLRRFYSTYYRPNNATLIVIGDVSTGDLARLLEQSLGRWERADVPAIRYPPPPEGTPVTRVYLIDRPGAAQSEIRVGHLSVGRDTEDYFPLLLLNTVLGGQFSSRINLNLREDKGYTYGARSAFSLRRAPGPFLAQAGVQTPSTRESVVEFMKELEEIRDGRPVTARELEFAKASLVRREPLGLETQGQLAARLEEVVLYDLPLDYFDHFTERVEAVTLADVERAARTYLDPSRFAIVVVGDRAVVEEGLRQLPYPLEIVSGPPAAGGR